MEQHSEKKINGTVYCIKNKINNKIYIGSTQQTLAKRLYKHKYDASRMERSILLYNEINEIGKDNFYIEPLEELKNTTLKELRQCEGKHISKQQAVLNQRKAGRDPKEYYIDKKDMFKERYENNLEKIKARDKERYKQNFDKIQEQKKKHRQENIERYKERDKKYYWDNRETRLQHSQEYRQKNHEKMKEYDKQYYQKHKERKNADRKKRYEEMKLKKQKEKEEAETN